MEPTASSRCALPAGWVRRCWCSDSPRTDPRLLRESDSRKDLTALRKIPVAKGRGGYARPRRPRATSEDAIALVEEHLGVLRIRMGGKAGVAVEDRGRPLPHLPDRVADSIGRVARRVAARGHGSAVELVEIAVPTRCRSTLAPRIRPSLAGGWIPTGRLLPLELAGQPGAVGAGERISLEPRNVNDRARRIEGLVGAQPPLGAQILGPAGRSLDLVPLSPLPPLLGPHLRSAVAAGLDELPVGAVGDGRPGDREPVDVYAVARPFVVVGEFLRRRPDRARAGGNLDQLEPGT